jgi:hypothetical protein
MHPATCAYDCLSVCSVCPSVLCFFPFLFCFHSWSCCSPARAALRPAPSCSSCCGPAVVGGGTSSNKPSCAICLGLRPASNASRYAGSAMAPCEGKRHVEADGVHLAPHPGMCLLEVFCPASCRDCGRAGRFVAILCKIRRPCRSEPSPCCSLRLRLSSSRPSINSCICMDPCQW